MKKTSTIPKHRFPTVEDAIKLYNVFDELNDSKLQLLNDNNWHLTKRQVAKLLANANFNKELHLKLSTNMAKFAIINDDLEIQINSKMFSESNMIRLLVDYDSFDSSNLTAAQKLAIYQLKIMQANILAAKYSEYSYFVLRRRCVVSAKSSTACTWRIYGILIDDIVDCDTGEVFSISRSTKICQFTTDSIVFVYNDKNVKKAVNLVKVLDKLDKIVC